MSMPYNPAYDLARDVFLVGCYTAQRVSDYSRIRAKNIRKLENGIRVIELIQQKTKEKVIIPIRPELEEILKKYSYNLPKVYEQKVNKNIKEVGKLAGIKEMINPETIKGGLTVKTETPKHQLIKTHTARRSGCTNMYLAGISPIDIMKISGHKSGKEFKKYINVTREQTAISLTSHPYFRGLKVVK
ncbi:MAG: site-specific integrase [Bacteroidales bacterium]|nr:site-specific integrase [Bacteroidales bacterium]